MHAPRCHPALKPESPASTFRAYGLHSRYAAPCNGGDSGAAYLAGSPAVWSTTPGSIPLRHGTGLSPNPGSLNHAYGHVLVPIVADPQPQLNRTLAAKRPPVNDSKVRGCAPSFCEVSPSFVVVGEGPVPSHRPQDDNAVDGNEITAWRPWEGTGPSPTTTGRRSRHHAQRWGTPNGRNAVLPRYGPRSVYTRALRDRGAPSRMNRYHRYAFTSVTLPSPGLVTERGSAAPSFMGGL